MIRYRRYRAFVAFVIISIFALYEFSGFTNWNVASTTGAGSLEQSGLSQDSTPQTPAGNAESNSFQAGPDVVKSEKPKEEGKIEVLPPALTKQAAPATTPLAELLKQDSSSVSTTATQTVELITPHSTLQGSIIDSAPVHELDDIAEVGEGRMEVIAPPEVGIPAIHWSKQPEHFPVETTIQLPSGTPLPIPRIQYKFGRESASELTARKEKLKAISDAVVHSWTGYKEKAWMKDEVRPVTGGSRDPFCGWAATLVDALDTLWIVGLKDEFEAAVKAIGDIDFTTSQRKDIPVFETTIRYLGGLLSAYDLSGGQHKILLNKAVELAEILMGAFDTPNRMPATFYRWMPTFASQPHRAGTHVVLAELGSLSMEFTRLAQLTREPKFYDAIDRITNAFLEWQSASGVNATLVPGLFPVHVDASGCEKPAQIKTHKSHYAPYAADGGAVAVGDALGVQAGKPVAKQQGSLPTLPSKTTQADATSQLSEKVDSKVSQQDSSSGNIGKIIGWDDPIREGDLDSKQAKAAVLNTAVDGNILKKRQLGGLDDDDEKTVDAKALAESIAQQETAAKKKILDKAVCIPRGLASSNSYGSDSFTIGGMADSLYEYFPKEYLLLGGLEDKYKVLYEKSMDAVIEKLLFRPMIPGNSDILFAGEFQAHSGSDQTGSNGKLKPEGAHLTCFAGGMFALGAKIFSRKEDLDYARRLTEGCVWAYNATNTGIMAEGFYLSMCESMNSCPWNQTKYYEDLDPYGYIRELDNANFDKRQLDDDIRPASPVVDVESAVPNSVPEPAPHGMPGHKPYKAPEQPSHEEFVLARIQDERLPPGITRITSRRYILRPEAIESVFYMYRITGEEHWREVGWQMFEAVQKYTFATFGASAIDDVTKEIPTQEDSEESFWLAETLKYFYLLFSDPDTVSLDEWVMNTEAHPFKRPLP